MNFHFWKRCGFAAVLLVIAFAEVRADWVDDYVNAQIRKRLIPGLSLAIIRDGKVLKAKGYGLANLEFHIPATKDTVYEIGSISKQFTAEAVMILIDEGKLNLDDSINKFLPANAPEGWRRITVRNLLNHTSGLKDWTELKEFSYRREYTPEEFIELINSYPLAFEPGENWLYSNSNFPLLGIIVERVSGKSYEDLVTQRILKPSGLGSIRFRHQPEIVPLRASGYALRGGVLVNGEPHRPKLIAPNGGILANAVDLAKWFEMVLNGRILKRSTVDQMLAPTRLKSGRYVNHGFAFFRDSFNGHPMIFHHGSTLGGFGSVVRNFPKEKLTLAIIGNLEDGGWGPEIISRRVANFYIPGVFVGGLKGAPDADTQQTQRFLNLLRSIAKGEDSPVLTESYRSGISADFRVETALNLNSLKSFVFLRNEKLASEHFVLDATLDHLACYKLVTSTREIFYTFRVNREGKVALILTDE